MCKRSKRHCEHCGKDVLEEDFIEEEDLNMCESCLKFHGLIDPR